MGSASSVAYLPDRLTEEDCRKIAGSKYSRYLSGLV